MKAALSPLKLGVTICIILVGTVILALGISYFAKPSRVDDIDRPWATLDLYLGGGVLIIGALKLYLDLRSLKPK